MLYTEYITYKQIGQNPHTSFKQDTNGQSNQGTHHGPPLYFVYICFNAIPFLKYIDWIWVDPLTVTKRLLPIVLISFIGLEVVE